MPNNYRYHVIGAARIAMQIEVVLALLHIELRQPFNRCSRGSRIAVMHRDNLRHALGYHRVGGIDAHRGAQLSDRFGYIAIQRELLGIVGVRADKLRAQRRSFAQHLKILRCVAGGFIVGRQRIVKAAFLGGFIASLHILLRALRVVHHGCVGRTRSRRNQTRLSRSRCGLRSRGDAGQRQAKQRRSRPPANPLGKFEPSASIRYSIAKIYDQCGPVDGSSSTG